MKTANKQLTWKSLAEELKISLRHLHSLRRKDDAPTTRDSEAWLAWLDGRAKTRIRDGSALADLKAQLTREQTRKEAALASLRELELKMKVDSLVPESDVMDRLKDVLIPLRRLLDALPRAVASQANPTQPNVAEVAIRKALDIRVFSEMERILNEAADEYETQTGCTRG